MFKLPVVLVLTLSLVAVAIGFVDFGWKIMPQPNYLIIILEAFV